MHLGGLRGYSFKGFDAFWFGIFNSFFLRPGSTARCMYGFFPPRNPGQNPGQKSGQKPGQKSGQQFN